MIKESIKFEKSTVFEGMTSIRALLEARENGINDRPINEILYDEEREKSGKISKEVAYLKKISGNFGFSVRSSNSEYINSITLGNSHGGIVAKCGERTLPLISESKDKLLPCGFYIMIEGIEDPYNFGYAIRSLYALGASGIVLPARNWLSAAGVVARSSAGASELMPSFLAESAPEAIDIFRQNGYKIVAADEDTEITLANADLSYPLFVIVGGEKRGISKNILSAVDVKVKIDYGRNFRASLSAASAVTVFGYEIYRQNNN